jgi:DNA-binding winged helix-turn-helix (wHTH) protein/TolB-like protein/Tfp pilus assembly protein PilF
MPEGQTIRFDGWTLDRALGELARDGRRIRLQDQPFQVLDELLAHPGELVTREQLIARLWPRVVVDFDTGLNSAVRKLRLALGDVAETPRYIETVPRRGYRFIGAIDAPPLDAVTPPRGIQDIAGPSPVFVTPDPVQPPESPRDPGPPRSSWRPLAYVAVAIAAVVAVLLIVRPPAASGVQTERAGVAVEAPTTPVKLAARTLAVLPFQTSATDDAGILLAQGLTDLVRNRLAALKDLTVVASSSTSALTDSQASARAIGEKLDAQVLLTGTADRDGERVQLAVQLVFAQSGERLWSMTFDRPLAELGAVREEIFQQVAGVLRVPVEPAASNASAGTSISLDAYLLYIRGQHLLASSTVQDARSAVELFRRATILDPGFARAYLGLGQAVVASGDKTSPNVRSDGWVATRPRTGEGDAQAAKAVERALELNPSLGEAWIERARLTADSVEAERLYRKGIALAPNYADGFAHYARFLFNEARTGEAIETISRASQIDPLTPGPYQLHAFLLMVARSDVVGHDQLLRKALAINPGLTSVLWQLANSRWEYSGEFADAAQLIEQAIAIDPQFALGRTLARDIYLDLGDRAAAAAVLSDALAPDSSMEIAQYDGDRKRAAALVTDVISASWRDTSGSHAPLAEAIRDGAVATGRLDQAVRLLGPVRSAWEKSPPMWSRGLSLVYAHTLVLAGEVDRGRQLAETTLALLDTHGVGRTENWFSRERAAAYAVLGDEERALDELAISVRTGKLYRWWYLSRHDPLFERLRTHPRFQAIDGQAQRHLQRQRALLEEMRRKGAVPERAGQTPR